MERHRRLDGSLCLGQRYASSYVFLLTQTRFLTSYFDILDLPTVDVEAIKSKLVSKNISFVAQRDVPGQEGQIVLYFSCKTVTNASFLVELKFKQGFNVCKITVKSSNKSLSELCKVTVAKLISVWLFCFSRGFPVYCDFRLLMYHITGNLVCCFSVAIWRGGWLAGWLALVACCVSDLYCGFKL